MVLHFVLTRGQGKRGQTPLSPRGEMMNHSLSYGSRQILQIDLELVKLARKEGMRGCDPGLAQYRWLSNITGPGIPAKKDQELGERSWKGRIAQALWFYKHNLSSSWHCPKPAATSFHIFYSHRCQFSSGNKIKHSSQLDILCKLEVHVWPESYLH